MPKIKLLIININTPHLSRFIEIENLEEFMDNKNIFEFIFFAIFEAHNGKAGKRIHIKIKATEGHARAMKSIISFIDLLHRENKTNQMAVKDPEKYMSDKCIETDSNDSVSGTRRFTSNNHNPGFIKSNRNPDPVKTKPGFIKSNRNHGPVKTKAVFIKPCFLKENPTRKTELPNGWILEAGLSISKNKNNSEEPVVENKPQPGKKMVVVKINSEKFRKSGRQYDR